MNKIIKSIIKFCWLVFIPLITLYCYNLYKNIFTSKKYSSFYWGELTTSYLIPPSNQTSFNTYNIEWTKQFRDNYKHILHEFLSFQQKINHSTCNVPSPHNLIYPNQYNLNKDSKWKTLTLYCYNNYETSIASHFPITMNIINKINANSFLPKIHLAMFSILPSNKSLHLHSGPNRGILRYQLGLQIPKHASNDLYLKVWNDTSFNKYNLNDSEITILKWNNGSDFLFDDTCYHAVYNNNIKDTMERIVLFIDAERHDLSFWRKLIHQLLVKIILSDYGLPLCKNVNERQNVFLENCNKL
eukprot:70331_1